MELKTKIRKELRERYGNFTTYLEHKYETKLVDTLVECGDKDRQAWATYNQVILELKHSLKNNLKVNELQYKLTDGDDPKQVCIEVMDVLTEKNPELERLYYKIKNF